MRFALYAGDSCGEQLLGRSMGLAAASLPGNKLTRVVGCPQVVPGMPPLPANVTYSRGWENLLIDADVDAVIVIGTGEERQQAVRQLVQAGKAVLVSPELLLPAAFYYEMALVEAEVPGSLFPLLGLRGHPLIVRLSTLLSQDGLGRLLHVQLVRKLPAGGANPLLSEADLSLALVRDADLLRCLCGNYDQVTASRSGDHGRGCSLATVTFSGSAAPQAVWTASAGDEVSEWRMTLVGDAGTAVLEGDPDCADFRLTLSLRGQVLTTEECADHAGPWLIKSFAESISHSRRPEPATGPSRGTDDRFVAGHLNTSRAEVTHVGERPGPNSLWDELSCAIELVEAVDRSVRRRRTIDVYFDTPSERGIFKTQMTAVGCSLLVLTLVAVVVYLGLAAAVGLPNLLKNILVALIFAPLAVFLILQLLVFVARPAARDGR